MKQIFFPSSFLTGHAVIDGDHRRLIAFLNDINNCFREKLGDKAKETCTALQRFMGEHMDREEEILHNAAFPRLQNHVLTHVRLAEACREVLATCGNVCLRNKAKDCTTRLSIAIIEHIVGSDLDFKSYLQDEGRADKTD